MLPVIKFEGELDGKKIEDFRKKLDYSIGDIQQRVSEVSKILNNNNGYANEYFEQYFDQNREPVPHFKANLSQSDNTSEQDYVCKNLEAMANYILFSKEGLSENDVSEHPYLTNKDERYSKKKEVSYEKKTDEDSSMETHKQKDKSEIYVPQYKMDKEFLKNNPYTSAIQETIDGLQQSILDYTEKVDYIAEKMKELPKDENYFLNYAELEKELLEVRSPLIKLKAYVKELRFEQRLIYDFIKKPIQMKGLLKSSTCYDFDVITLDNPEHVQALIEHYSKLKMDTYTDFGSDIKYLLEELEDSIDSTDIEEYERDILILKIDGLKNKDIVKYTKENHDITILENKFSRIMSRLSVLISDANKTLYDNWYYKNIDNIEFRTCLICKKQYPLTDDYFAKRNDTGKYRSDCKKCHNKK